VAFGVQLAAVVHELFTEPFHVRVPAWRKVKPNIGVC
jgi:hypothetical protein